jgi:hypothetical protein
MPAVVVANWLDINDISAGTQTNDIKVTLDNELVDISDRAARLLGKVYGSQGQPLTQTATNYNLRTELAVGGTLIDPRNIRALTSSDVVDISDRAARDLGKIDIAAFDVALPAGDNNIGNVDVLTIANDYARQLGSIKLVDRNGYALDVADDTALPGNYSVILIAGHDAEDVVRTPTVTVDPGDGKHRIAVDGKFSLSPPAPPSTATAVTIAADNPLDVSSNHTTDYTISNGVTFHMTQITFGAEGDPNEKGSKATISYVDSSSVEHVVERLYFTGFTAQVFPDTAEARDGTEMTGNGSTTKIRIIRERLGGAALEIDCVVRGYEQ